MRAGKKPVRPVARGAAPFQVACPETRDGRSGDAQAEEHVARQRLHCGAVGHGVVGIRTDTRPARKAI